MKKILIVNNNLDMGGIQKSLVNLLKHLHGRYDITLLLFSKSGALLKDVPEDVAIITPQKTYRMLGLTKQEMKQYPVLFVLKGFLVKFTDLFSRRSAMKLLGLFQKKLCGYDAVISYSHLPSHKYFGNGCGDFVLDKTVCDNKICLIHCDYLNSGYMTAQNNAEYAQFDKIACCSDSVKHRFLQGSHVPANKVYTLRNFYDSDVIELSKEGTYDYDSKFINVLSVARLSSEKGIDRAVDALHNSARSTIRYYIIGDGPQKDKLLSKIKAYGMKEQVFLLGEQKNPYRFMAKADYLLVPSLHEAAPMVFDEAKVLGLKVITTNTTSATEMVGNYGGIVCDNSIEGIEKALAGLHKEAENKKLTADNNCQHDQFAKILSY